MRAAWKAPNIYLHGLHLGPQGWRPCQSLCRKSGLREGRPHAQGNIASQQLFPCPFPTPPPQMPSSEHLPTPTDALSHPTRATWAQRGHQGPDTPGTPRPNQPCGWRPHVSEEDIGRGSSCTCTQLGRIQPPQKQHSQPVSYVVSSLHLAGHSCAGHSINIIHNTTTICEPTGCRCASPICTALPEHP